ncbi:uncharacterized protein CELE_T05C12.9 [Caenorhabditis elegans]|uniref:Uncharacterized protein n=1 Tax=Caenorhabditis elegans TaxID=6239 RepID=Q22231_CAEEL|nr:Uncharacterized protein CELE_T05C12.9 [Caenorhabditis elegans]CAA91311.3 Uncharacterized protein CELE_T05C12.9 [Caenorhabditis elegans]
MNYLKINRHSRNVLIFLQIISVTMLCAILYPVFRTRLLLGSTRILAIALPFSSGFTVLCSLLSNVIIKTKYRLAMTVTLGISVISLVTVIGFTIAVYQSIGSTSEESFQQEFLKVLEQKSEKGMRTLHKFQKITECCGVPLPTSTGWNQSSITPSSPWTSWFYYTLLGDEYIDETRRLFTLPWSCCSDRTLDCEHLAFERVSIKPSSKDVIIDELVEIQHRLRNSRKNEDGRRSVYDNVCESPAKSILGEVPFQLVIISSIFAILSLISIGLDGFFVLIVNQESEAKENEFNKE